MSSFIHCAVMSDKSGSMTGKETIVQKNLQFLFDRFATSMVPMEVSLYSFNHELQKIGDYKHTELPKAPGFPTVGGTHLYRSMARVCEELYARPTPLFHDPVYLVHVLTDGQDESFPRHKTDTISKLYKAPNWTFAISGPDQFKSTMARDLGIPESIILGWDGKTEASYDKAQGETRSSFSAYVDQVSKGKLKVASFYAAVTPDIEKCPNAPPIREYKVDKDVRVDELYKVKKKQEYQKGSVYYELIKDELVQADKAIIAIHKVKGVRVLPTRESLGLVSGQDAKVTPGNFGDWRIFVQSKAPNRKLPRGSRVLIV